MKNYTQSQITSAIALLLLSIQSTAFAAPYNLVQYPAGTGSRQPTPNVVVSVDDSGSMGAAGMQSLRAALSATFAPSNLADGSIRLAYQAMTACRNIPATSANSDSMCYLNGQAWNTMRDLQGKSDPSELSSRGQFFRFINGLGANSSTYSHNMVLNAGEYLKTTGINNPYNSTPGQADSDPLACRKSYHIFMTDGGWNAFRSNNMFNFGDVDGLPRTLGDGTTNYDPLAAQSRIYADSWGGFFSASQTNLPTLSDLSFKYWAEDLQPGIANNLIPSMPQNSNETFTAGSASQILTPFWNPRNNPATWQNMITYTIGYNNAASWPNIATNPIFNATQGMYGGDFSAAIVGTKAWRNPLTANEAGRAEELWHMAINGRGRFYPARTPQDLMNAFNTIVQSVVADNTTPITSFAASSTNNQQSDVGVFISGYAADNWTGYVKAQNLAAGQTNYSTTSPWGTNVTTATLLDNIADTNNRFALTATDDGATQPGISFSWSSGNSTFTDAQKTILRGSGDDTTAENLVKFIRGDRTNEGTLYRTRTSRQGDIVNSKIWYVGEPVSNYHHAGFATFAKNYNDRKPMLYVGGNDGMLHGFSAEDGVEKISYIPKGIIQNLSILSDKNYTHRYYVDGSPFSGEYVDTNGNWKTALIGTLGAGGRGYFILDITNPGSASGKSGVGNDFTSSKIKDLVLLDNTQPSNLDPALADNFSKDIGHIFSPPVTDNGNPFVTSQISKMNNGKWALVTGNGYNSINESAVLIIQFLDGSGALRIQTDGVQGNGNGLSAPRLVDINGDGSPDIAYAGDLKGNLWKFDLSSKNSANWITAFNSRPLYTAKYISGSSSTEQPITSTPTVKANASIGGMMVAFGTGRNITEDDRTSTTEQTLYSIIDRTTYSLDNTGLLPTDTPKIKINQDSRAVPVANGRTRLVAQSINGTGTQGANENAAYKYWATTSSSVDFSTKDGWYMDLPVSGERVLQTFDFYDKSNLLEVYSSAPASGGSTTAQTCAPASSLEKPFLTLVNIFNGKPPSIPLMNSNGSVDTLGKNTYESTDVGNRQSLKSSAMGRTVNSAETRFNDGGGGTSLARMPTQLLRPNWRQLQ